MKQRQHIWVKEAFIGHELLHANNKPLNISIVFAGAEKKEHAEEYKIHFILNYTANPAIAAVGYGVNIFITTVPGTPIRFENHFGITEDASAQYRPEEYVAYKQFYRVKHIRFLSIETDHLQYEIHCL